MPAGRLRERVRFERREAIEDGYGNEEGGWETLVAAVAAQVTPIRGGEAVQAARLAGLTTYEIRVRASAAVRSVRTGDRAVDERSGESFNIRAIVNPDQRDRFLALTVEAGGADG